MNKRFAAGLGGVFAAAILFSACNQSAAPPSATEKTGWLEADGVVYYLSSDGSYHTGWLELDSKRYYMRSDGSMVTGWLSLDGAQYYLGSDGSAVTGIASIQDTYFVFDSTGLLTTGWAQSDGSRCFADSNGHPVSGWQQIDDRWYYFDEDFHAHTGWLQDASFSYYFLEDGSAATGQLTIGDQICYFTQRGQQIIVVNPWNFIPEDYEVELVDIGNQHQVAAIAYDDLQAMISDCQAAGFVPAVCSSYRTQEYQQKLYQRRIQRFIDQGYSDEEATSLAGTIVAVPGTSEHQLGLALDIVDNRNWALDESQAIMPTQQWLMENSWRYGWILRYPDGTSESTGIIYEPWHYRYVGRQAAADIHESGLCLEDYLAALTHA